MRTTTALSLLCLTVAAAIGCTPESTDGGSGVEQTFTPFAHALTGAPSTGRIVSGTDGSLYLAGTFKDAIDFGGGTLKAEAPNTIYVAHLDESGNHLMSGSTGANDWLGNVSVGSDGTYFLGGAFEGSINFGAGKMTAEHAAYLAAFNPDGSTQFARDFVDSNAQTYVDGVAARPDGSVAISARTTDHVDFGIVPPTSNGAAQVEVAVYDSNGILSWQLRFDGATSGPTALAADDKGHLYLAGATYSGCTIGFTQVSPYSMFVAEIDEKGQPVWVQQSVTPNGYGFLPTVADISVDSDGGVYVAGTYYYAPFTIGGISTPPTQTTDVFLLKLDGSGNGVYAKGYPVNDSPSPISVAGTKDGEVLFAVGTDWAMDLGSGGLGGNNKENAILGRYDAKGNLLKGISLGGYVGKQHVYDVAADPDGNAVILGSFQGTLDIGDEHFESVDERQSFVARLKL
ncbi:MAG: hypothetical protein U0441_34665 [Polyangiaceae bacterium]